jgi:hypothetical protein
MEITQEYLDKKFEDFEGYLDRRFGKFAILVGQSLGDFKIEIRENMKEQKQELENFIIQGFEHHQTWVREEFKEWIKPYDVRDRVAKIESQYSGIKI